MPSNRLKNSQCGSSIHGAELCLRFQSEWKTHRLFLAQHLFNHLVVAMANDGPARIRFRYPSPDRSGQWGFHWLLREELQKAQRSEEHTSELQSRPHLVCRLLLEKKK